MAEIRNLTRNGETFYPLTCTDAIVNRDGGYAIDDVPTVGSDNLVKSGGVAIGLNKTDISLSMQNIENLVNEFRRGSLSTSGVFTASTTSSYYTSNSINVQFGHYYLFNKSGHNAGAAALVEFSGETVVSYIAHGVNAGTFVYTPSSQTVTNVMLCVDIMYSELGFVDLTESIYFEKSQIKSLYEAKSQNLANKDNILDNSIVDNVGDLYIGTASGWGVEVVDIPEGVANITIGGFKLGRSGYGIFRDLHDRNIGSVVTYNDPDGVNYLRTISVPAGAKKFYFDVYSTSDTPNYSNLMVNEGSYLQAYVPYDGRLYNAFGYPLTIPELEDILFNISYIEGISDIKDNRYEYGWVKGIISPDGSLTYSGGASYAFTQKLPVTAGDTIKIRVCSLNANTKAFAFYSSDGTLVSVDESQYYTKGGTSVISVTVPVNATTIILQTELSNLSTDLAGIYHSPFFGNKPTLDKFSEQNDTLLWNGNPIQSELSNVVVDLPVSDGTNIQSGYAYIDSSTRNVKVKA